MGEHEQGNASPGSYDQDAESSVLDDFHARAQSLVEQFNDIRRTARLNLAADTRMFHVGEIDFRLWEQGR